MARWEPGTGVIYTGETATGATGEPGRGAMGELGMWVDRGASAGRYGGARVGGHGGTMAFGNHGMHLGRDHGGTGVHGTLDISQRLGPGMSQPNGLRLGVDNRDQFALRTRVQRHGVNEHVPVFFI